MTASPVFPDTSDARDKALLLSARLHRTRYQEEPADEADEALLGTATAVWRWLAGPAYILLTTGPVTDQDTGEIDDMNHGGSPMQIHDNQQFTATVTLASAKGNVIGDLPGQADDLQWSVDTGDDVISLEVSEDSRTATVKAVDTGSAVVRVVVPGTEPELFATLAVDVVAGPAALITIETSEPTDQPAAEPEPEPQPQPEV